MGYFILVLLTTADDYFSVNIAQIVEHFKISQNIAGVTFMAFGNGAPDIFNSLASILSSKNPKAGLALGELLGAIIFLSTIVAGSIGMIKNFTVMRRPFIRDILFFYPPFVLLLISFITTNSVHIWLPITFLVIYIIYAIIVILSQYIRKGMIKAIDDVRSTKQQINISVITTEDEVNDITSTSEVQGPVITVTSLEEPIPRSRPESFSNYYTTPSNNLKTPILTRHNSLNSLKERAKSFIIDHSSLFVPNNEEEEEEEMVYVSRTRKSIFVHDARSRAESELTNNNAKLEKKKRMLKLNIIQKIWADINPWDQEMFDEENISGKIFFILKLPIFLALNISCPLGDREWNKWLTLVHIFICPIILFTAFQGNYNFN